ncbi:DUF6090 family protein [Sediminicola sp. YIK13]|uniref:DUF6090 family protein n=1 Tax=Sediminicola sp. YIK13 TaxID=1453352 RepID=UPI0007810BCC|nr:DUF6090 family protein [Sediminicola sp. YIK13]
MIKFFRKIRKRLLAQSRFSKYLLYAIGEIVLVVIGILIALQINNWNQNKLEQNSLSAYLTSISQNIKVDIKNLEYLKTTRKNIIARIPHLTFALTNSDFLERKDVKFGSEALSILSNFEYFNADLSGFESIKNSGYLSKLKGKDIENLIYKYYNLVQEINTKEKDFNEILKNSYSDLSRQGFEKLIYLNYPDYIGDQNELIELQPYLKEMLFHPSAISLYNQTYDRGPELVIKYDNLSIIGAEIVRMIENNINSLDSVALKNLDNIFNPKSTKGYSQIVSNGAPTGFFDSGYASFNGEPVIMIPEINKMDFHVPDTEWSVAYFRHPSNAMIERPSKDYSDYRSLKLELKGATGGETVFIALKDSNDADDGSESRVFLTLSNEWKTYEIPLSKFKTADLKDLFVVTSFVFLNGQQSLSIRNLEFLKK